MTVLTLIYVPGLLLFLRASRDARLQEVTLLDPHGLAAQRLVLARRRAARDRRATATALGLDLDLDRRVAA
jgi:hypothetical protein